MVIVKIVLAYILGGFVLLLIMFVLWGFVEYLRAKTSEIEEKRVLREARQTFIEMREKHKDDRELVGKFTEMIDLIDKSK